MKKLLEKLIEKRLKITEVSETVFIGHVEAMKTPMISYQIRQYIESHDVVKFEFGYIPNKRRFYRVVCKDGETNTWNLAKTNNSKIFF